MDRLLQYHPSRTWLFGLPFAAGALSLALWLRASRSTLGAQSPSIIPSPLASTVLPLSEHEAQRLPYPPDALPGARDVDTPYGSMRVYEFGPESGHKVLLLHGISTPSIALGSLAHHLVERGCRVMLFGKCSCSTFHPRVFTASARMPSPNLSAARHIYWAFALS